MARAPQTREPGSLIHCTVSQAGFKKVSQAKSTAQSQLPIESLVAVLQPRTGSATDAHLHAREVHRLVHQDPRGCLKARRDGHGSIVSDETTRLWVNLLYVQAGQ